MAEQRAMLVSLEKVREELEKERERAGELEETVREERLARERAEVDNERVGEAVLNAAKVRLSSLSLLFNAAAG